MADGTPTINLLSLLRDIIHEEEVHLYSTKMILVPIASEEAGNNNLPSTNHRTRERSKPVSREISNDIEDEIQCRICRIPCYEMLLLSPHHDYGRTSKAYYFMALVGLQTKGDLMPVAR